jgi:glycogen operon protein
MRNILTTLLVSQGCPMILGGDEIGRTQRGNNNGYCQDNEISWFDWEHTDEAMLAFTRRVIALRASQPVLRRRHFFQGQVGRGARRKDIAWFRRDGEELRDEDWSSDQRQSLGMLLNGDLIPDKGRRGERIQGDTLLVLLHSSGEGTAWTIPTGWGRRWEVLLDTAKPAEPQGTRTVLEGEALTVMPRSVVVLRRVGPGPS